MNIAFTAIGFAIGYISVEKYKSKKLQKKLENEVSDMEKKSEFLIKNAGFYSSETFNK